MGRRPRRLPRGPPPPRHPPTLEEAAYGFVSGGRGGRVHLWRPVGSSFSRSSSVQAHAGAVLCLRPSGDGFSSTGADGSIARWSVASGHPVLEARRSVGSGVAWLWAMDSDGGSGAWLVEGSDHVVHLDSALREIDRIALPVDVRPRSLARGPNDALAVGLEDGRVLLRPSGGVDWETLAAHDGAVRALVFLDEGQLASGGEDCRVRTWVAGVEVGVRSHEDFVTSLLRLPAGGLLSTSFETEHCFGKKDLWFLLFF